MTASGLDPDFYSIIVGRPNTPVSLPISINDENQDQNINDLAESLRSSDLWLHLGAGVSIASGAPSWENLFARTVSTTIEQKYPESRISSALPGPLERNLRIIELFDRNRILFLHQLRLNLYQKMNMKSRNASPDFIEIFLNIDSKIRCHNIVTYNYDDLVERRIKRAQGRLIKSRSIFSQRSYDKFQTFEGLKIYHPHGYISRSMPIDMIVDQKIAFSEREYNNIYRSNINWRNFIHTSNAAADDRPICRLFFGFSFSDTNVRALLEIDQSEGSQKSKLFALMKAKPHEITRGKLTYKNSLVHIDLLSLGVRPIWWALPGHLKNIAKKIGAL